MLLKRIIDMPKLWKKTGYHSLTFIFPHKNDFLINTWDDWHLIPTSRPTFATPKIKERTLDIPGADGVLDLSELYMPSPVYSNREGSFEFIVMNDYGYWQNRYDEIMNLLHGRVLRIVAEDDPAFYYQGRVSVNEWKSDPTYSLITFDYNLNPYKYGIISSLDDWLWDPFNFETGVIREYRNLYIPTLPQDPENGQLHIIEVIGSRAFSSPLIRVTDGKNVQVRIKEKTNGAAYSDPVPLSNGANTLYDFILEDKSYIFAFVGTGTVGIDYTEGSL